MKALAHNTFISFENEVVFTSNEDFQTLVKRLSEGLNEDLFIAIYGVLSTYYTGYSIFVPKSGDLSRGSDIAQMASDHSAEGAIVIHMINAPSNMMHETRHICTIQNHLAGNGINCLDYCILKDGKLTSFDDTAI